MTELTAELIVDQHFPHDVQISPDGKQVAYTVAPLSKKEEHATSAIWVTSTEHAREARQFTSGEAHDYHARWSPDCTQLAFLSDRAKRGTPQLYFIAADGGEAVALTTTKNKKSVADFAWSPGGGQLAFTSADEPTEEDKSKRKSEMTHSSTEKNAPMCVCASSHWPPKRSPHWQPENGTLPL